MERPKIKNTKCQTKQKDIISRAKNFICFLCFGDCNLFGFCDLLFVFLLKYGYSSKKRNG